MGKKSRRNDTREMLAQLNSLTTSHQVCMMIMSVTLKLAGVKLLLVTKGSMRLEQRQRKNWQQQQQQHIKC